MFRIVAPHFVAGGVYHEKVIIRVAPIIKYLLGWSEKDVMNYCQKKGWNYEKLG